MLYREPAIAVGAKSLAISSLWERILCRGGFRVSAYLTSSSLTSVRMPLCTLSCHLHPDFHHVPSGKGRGSQGRATLGLFSADDGILASNALGWRYLPFGEKNKKKRGKCFGEGIARRINAGDGHRRAAAVIFWERAHWGWG